jgi:hypothetical protein
MREGAEGALLGRIEYVDRSFRCRDD